MAYNKARAEKQWNQWKRLEEKKLRELGMEEEWIQNLHICDWADFNRERRYLQRQTEWSSYVDIVSAQELELPLHSMDTLLDEIEDTRIVKFLVKQDRLTLYIVWLKVLGYNGPEIAAKTGLSPNAVNIRIMRLRNKLKKHLDL